MNRNINLEADLKKLFDVVVGDVETKEIKFACICTGADLVCLAGILNDTYGITAIPHNYKKEN